MSWLAGAALLVQVVQAAAIPVLSRVFSPTALGVWAVIQSVVVTGASVAGLRYELAMPLVADDEQARRVARLQFACTLVTGVLVMALVAMGGLLPREVAGHVDPALLVAGAFALVVGGAAFQLVSQTCIRDSAFGRLAALRAVNGPGQTLAQIGAGLATAGRPSALLAGAAVGTALSLAMAVRTLRRYLGQTRSPIRFADLADVARRFRRFPLFVVPYSLLTLARDRGLFLLVAAYVDLAAVGAVAMAQRLVSIPVGLVSAAVSPVLHRRLAGATNRAALEQDVRRVMVALVWFGVGFFGVLAGLAFLVVPFVLGPDWRAAADVSAALAAWGLTLFLSAVFDRTFDLVDKQSVALWIEGANSVLSLGVLWVVLALGWPLAWALFAFASVQVVHHAAWIGGAWLAVGFGAHGLRVLALHSLAALACAAAVVLPLRTYLQS